MVEMITESLATKYRPVLAKDVIGQEAFKNMLKSIKSSGKVPKAVLFTGETGCGKTTLARVLARHINKIHDISIANDVYEYNIGTNGTAEDIRDLVSKLKFMPRNKDHKSIYILDEVHRLTKTSASALLKEIEEPPAHVVFILCTNEPGALLPTIRNRCQKVELKPYTLEQIIQLLKKVCDGEDFSVKDEILQRVAEGCNSQLREALVVLQGLFDQLKANKNLSDEELNDLLKEVVKFDEYNNVGRFLVCLYMGNLRVAYQELLKATDMDRFLSLAQNMHQRWVKILINPNNLSKQELIKSGIGFTTDFQSVEVIQDKIQKKGKKVEVVIPYIIAQITELLVKVKEKSLIAAFNLQDCFLAEAGKCCIEVQNLLATA